MKTCSYIYSLVLFFAAAGQIFSSCAGHDSHEELSPELELLMVRLDSVLEKAPEYTAQKEERIAKLRLSFENTGNRNGVTGSHRISSTNTVPMIPTRPMRG